MRFKERCRCRVAAYVVFYFLCVVAPFLLCSVSKNGGAHAEELLSSTSDYRLSCHSCDGLPTSCLGYRQQVQDGRCGLQGDVAPSRSDVQVYIHSRQRVDVLGKAFVRNRGLSSAPRASHDAFLPNTLLLQYLSASQRHASLYQIFSSGSELSHDCNLAILLHLQCYNLPRKVLSSGLYVQASTCNALKYYSCSYYTKESGMSQGNTGWVAK